MNSRLFGSPLWQRFRPLAWLGACFVAIAFLTRLILLLMAGSGVPLDPGYWMFAFGVGFVYDLVTFVYFAWPLVLFLWLVPSQPGRLAGWLRWLLYAGAVVSACTLCLGLLRWRYDANWRTAWPAVLPFLFVLPCAAFTYRSRAGQWALYSLCLLLLFALLLIGAAELTFWNEFSTRFNFIAVDYLVYTSEVIGNIEQSYPVGLWLTLIALIALVVLVLGRRSLHTGGDNSRLGARSRLVAVWLGLTAASAFVLDGSMKDATANMYVNALAGNGIYQFFAAYRNQGLNFHRFYQSLPDARAYAIVRKSLLAPSATYVDDDPHDLTRIVRNPGAERDLDVVLISVESLSASYMGVFGNRKHLTPFLDDLAGKSLFFDRMYANGTRTVRGLEAITLSIPPTPGNSLVHQNHSDNLFSLGRVFDAHGYVSQFVYGGYGEFDDMNRFFAGSGYEDVDRRDIAPTDAIHSQNVWGVADEDLFTLAMRQMDRIHGAGKHFFLHIMTTSNHRPYTWPADRVDMPQGKRDGAVKYTDWAIGDFIRRLQAKPYFKDTVFVVTADHCADSAGRTRIPIDRYHIPLLIYSPAHIPPRTVHALTSQIDIAPTLLALLHFDYRSRFFGRNVLDLPADMERAFPSTYSNLGYLQNDRLTIQIPRHAPMQVKPDPRTGAEVPYPALDQAALDQAIAYYQVAYDEFTSGRMHWRPGDAAPVSPESTTPITADSVSAR